MAEIRGRRTITHFTPETKSFTRQTLTFDPENRLMAYSMIQTDSDNGDDLQAWK